MYEYVSAVFALDESITFFCVKPFNFTLHAKHSLHLQIAVGYAHTLTIPSEPLNVNVKAIS